jgi:hypothetical protein
MTRQETAMTAAAAQFEQAPAHSEQPRSIRTLPGWLAGLVARPFHRRARTVTALPQDASTFLRIPRVAALWTVAALVLASAGVSFAESYRGLYLWSERHSLHGIWAAVWPLQVDVFIAVGEVSLFIALVDGWRFRSRLAAWVVTGVGLGVSVVGNIGHINSHAFTNRATAAVPPLAAAAALAVGLGVLKRVAEAHRASQSGRALTQSARDALGAARMTLAASVAATNPLSQRALMTRFGISRDDARDLHAELVGDPATDGSTSHE